MPFIEKILGLIRELMTSALYVAAFPLAVAIKLVADPMSLRRSKPGWRRWPKSAHDIEQARRPYS